MMAMRLMSSLSHWKPSRMKPRRIRPLAGQISRPPALVETSPDWYERMKNGNDR